MAGNAGEAYVEISPDLSGFGTELSAKMRPALASAESSVSSSGSRMRSAMGTAGKYAGLAFLGIGAGAAVAVGAGLKVASSMEQARIGFTTMLGSAEKADVFLRDLQAFAAETPFEFQELTAAAGRLSAVGTETSQIIPLMTSLGDATSAMGTGAQGIDRAVTALTQMQQKGKVTGEEMLQLAEAGIPAWDALASHMGTTVAEAQAAVSAGSVGAEEIFTALETRSGAAMQKVSGMMEKQSATLAGMFSTLKDTVSLELGNAVMPLVDSLKDVLPQLSTLIGDLLATVGPAFAALFGELAKVFTAILPVIIPILEQLASVFVKVLGVIGPALGTIVKALAPALAVVMDALEALIDAILPLIPIIANVIKSLMPFVVMILEVAGAIIGALGPALGSIIAIVVGALLPILVQLLDAFSPLFPVITELVVAIVPLLQILAELVALIGGAVIKVVAGLVVKLVEVLVPAIKFVAKIIATLVRVVTTVVSAIIGGKGFGRAFAFFQSLPAKIAGFFGAAGKWLLEAGRAIIRGLLEGIRFLWELVKIWYVDIPLKILGFFGDAGTWLLDAGKAIIQGLWDGMKDIWDDATGWIGGLAGKIADLKGPLDKDKKLLVPAGNAIMGGFEKGLREGFGPVERFLGGIAPNVRIGGGLRGGSARALEAQGRFELVGVLELTEGSRAYIAGVARAEDQAAMRHARTRSRMGVRGGGG